MSEKSDSSSLPTSTMEGKVDDETPDVSNSALITRPVRNRKQKKYEGFYTFGVKEPLISSTPIKRSNSKENKSNLFSPSTDLNFTCNQSSMLDDTNITSEINNETPNQTWTEHSLSHVKCVEKRAISGMDSTLHSPTPVKRKRGRPRKLNSASIDQSSELLTQDGFDSHVGEAEEKVTENRRLNETYSSSQEEDNPHRLDIDNREGKSTASGPVSDNSQLIDLVQNKAVTASENKADDEKEANSTVNPSNASTLVEKRGRGRPRKHGKETNNSQMNNTRSLNETPILDCISSNSKNEIHKDAATGELSTYEEGEKRQGDASKGGPPTQEPYSLTQPNIVSGSGVKRGRGRPRKYNPTQPMGKVEDHSIGSLATSQKEDSSQCSKDVLGNAEDWNFGKNEDDAVPPSPICGEKERSYKDSHQSSYVEEQETDNSFVQSSSASCSTMKRRRGRPPKIVTKRGRGRPQKDGANFESASNEHHLNENHQQTVRSSRKRKAVRGESSDSDNSEASLSDETEEWQMSSSRGRGRGQTRHIRGRGGGNKSSNKMALSENIKCTHCELLIKSVKDYKTHLMSKHSLVYTPEQMHGVNDPYQIVRRQGYVDCQQCGRRFKNAQYYGHHIIWCGRENEMFFCPICQRETKVMWQKQHNRMHTQQEQIKAQVEKRKEEELKRKEEKEEEKQGDETSGKKKRKAACNAISILNNLEMADEGTVCSDESATVSDDEDDEEDDDEEENEEITNRREKKMKKDDKRKAHLLSAKYKMWIQACQLIGCIPQSEKLKRLQNYYNGAGASRLFSELSPISENWKVMSSREREKYLPHLKQSPVVSSVHGKSTDSETFTLRMGESRCVQGKAFCYTGGPIWAMEWCPRPVDHCQEQVLAIASDNQPGHHLYVNTSAKGSNLLQFWSVRREKESTQEMSPRLDFCIAHDSGYVRSVCWCPVGCFDETGSREGDSSSTQENVPSTLPRLGLLAVACSDATIPIFSIPHPSSIKSLIQSTSDHDEPIIFKPKPCLKLVPNSRSDATPCLSVSWQNCDGCEWIIGGYGRGEVLMWSLASSPAIPQEDIKTIRPIRVFLRHKSGVVSCAWCPSLPHFFVSCDYSGYIYLWNSNRPLEPESVLKKAGPLITKSIYMAGPVHWGFFTSNDKTCIPDLECRKSDNYHVNFHGFCPQCTVSADFNATVLMHSVCTWDVTFDPVFNILATCDAAGNVCVALPNEETLLCNICLRTFSLPSQTLQTVLYKLSVTQEDKDSNKKTLSPTATDGKEAEKVQQPDQVKRKPVRANCSERVSDGESSVLVNESETSYKENVEEDKDTGSLSRTSEMSPKNPVQNKTTLDNMTLCYHDSEMGKGELEKTGATKNKKKVEMKFSERENFCGSHMESIQRVRLCPGMDTNLWLASGGNAGMLRFDSLYDLIIRFTKKIEREVYQLKQSMKTADS